jgi:hypothetical protein
MPDRGPVSQECPNWAVEWQWTLLAVGLLDIVGALGVHAGEGEPAEIWGSVGLYLVPELDHQLTIQRLACVDLHDVHQRPEPVPVIQNPFRLCSTTASPALASTTRLLVSN